MSGKRGTATSDPTTAAACAKFIPPVGTRSGVPAVQGENEIFCNLFLPSGPTPSEGWTVVIFGHGGMESKQGGALLVAGSLAARRLATIAINMVGHGGGAAGTLTVSTPSGPVTFSPLLLGIALGAQEHIAEFFASDGIRVIDPDGSSPLSEVPIVPPLPEELHFIP